MTGLAAEAVIILQVACGLIDARGWTEGAEVARVCRGHAAIPDGEIVGDDLRPGDIIPGDRDGHGREVHPDIRALCLSGAVRAATAIVTGLPVTREAEGPAAEALACHVRILDPGTVDESAARAIVHYNDYGLTRTAHPDVTTRAGLNRIGRVRAIELLRAAAGLPSTGPVF